VRFFFAFLSICHGYLNVYRREHEFVHFGKALPRSWEVLNAAQGGATLDQDVLRGCKRVVVIGIHGWFPGEDGPLSSTFQ
jgi:hypothetical protein